MIMALVVMLVVTMVSVVILSAATANAGRVRRNKTDQQAYLTVSSAAQLMRDKMKDVTYITTQKTNYDKKGAETGTSTTVSTTGEEAFSDAMKALIQAVDAYHSDSEKEITFNADNMNEVTATVKMISGAEPGTEKYSFLAGFSLSEDDGSSNSYMSLSCTASSNTTTTTVTNNGGSYSTVTTTTISWHLGEITKGK